MEQEEREVKPHREETVVVNLGIGREKKEVKVNTCIFANVRDELVTLLRDYQDIFAWSYQDMPGLSLENCATQATSESRVLPGKAKIKENETRDVPKDKGGGEEAVQRWFLSHCSAPKMGRQYRASPEKGWEGANVCGLLRSKLSQSKG